MWSRLKNIPTITCSLFCIKTEKKPTKQKTDVSTTLLTYLILHHYLDSWQRFYICIYFGNRLRPFAVLQVCRLHPAVAPSSKGGGVHYFLCEWVCPDTARVLMTDWTLQRQIPHTARGERPEPWGRQVEEQTLSGSILISRTPPGGKRS